MLGAKSLVSGPPSFIGGAFDGPGIERREVNMEFAGEVFARAIGGGIALEDNGGRKWFHNGAGGISDGGTMALLSTRISSVCIEVDE